MLTDRTVFYVWDDQGGLHYWYQQGVMYNAWIHAAVSVDYDGTDGTENESVPRAKTPRRKEEISTPSRGCS